MTMASRGAKTTRPCRVSVAPMNFELIDSVELMSWKENDDVTASKTPTPLAS